MRHLRTILSIAAGISMVLATVALVSCQGRARVTDSATPYAQAVQRVKGLTAPTSGSAAEINGLRGIKSLLTDWTPSTIASRAKAVYAPDAYFHDTLVTLRDNESIAKYFEKTALGAKRIAVTIDDESSSSEGSYYLRWTMETQINQVSQGEPIKTVGITQIRLNEMGRVVFHHDFWDSSAGLFEHLPIMGRGIRIVKQRIGGE